jgi:hypothetical protein
LEGIAGGGEIKEERQHGRVLQKEPENLPGMQINCRQVYIPDPYATNRSESSFFLNICR